MDYRSIQENCKWITVAYKKTANGLPKFKKITEV